MNRSLRARLTYGMIAITVALAVVAVAAVTALTRLGGAVDTILRENYRSVIACGDMAEALERQDSAALFAAQGHEDIARPMLAEHRARFERAFAVEAHNLTIPGEREAVRALDAGYRDYTRAVDRALAEAPREALTATYFRELLPRFNAVRRVVEHISRMNQRSMERADQNARGMARRSAATTVGVGALALAVALWLAWRLPKTLVRPLDRLADAARAVGGGDLDVVVASAGVAELDPLTEAFQKMIARLKAYRQSSLGELLAAKDLANATVRCLLDPVVVLGSDGDVLLTNEVAERTFRVRVGSADELRAAEVSLPAEFVRARDEVLTTGRPVAPRSFSEAMRRGERYFLVRAAPLYADPGEGARVIVVAQDVTRLRRIDDLKSDMVATVSHEFKTPLTSLRMATHLLLEPAAGPLTEAQREIVTTARDDTERLRALVDELLDLVRIETEAGELRLTSVDPRRLLHAAVEAHRTIARDKGVALEIEDGPALPHAEVDPEKLGIVLANLVSNAVRHTPAGGRVTLGATRDGAALRITIRDTGEGVASEELARLFERDARAARSAHPHAPGRHGLGLTIAQEIVLQHGGELVARSDPGRGSVFTVALPLPEVSPGA